MPTYTLCRLVRPRYDHLGPVEEVQKIEAADDAKAILNAQALAAEFDGAFLEIELANADDRVIWRLIRPDPGP